MELHRSHGHRPIYGLIEKHSDNGAILDARMWNRQYQYRTPADSYAGYRGVDISQVAIDKRRVRALEHGRDHVNSYACADMLSYVPDEKYDFDCLPRVPVWYVRRPQAVAMLRRYANFLEGARKASRQYLSAGLRSDPSVPLSNEIFSWLEKFVEERRGLIVVFQ